MIERKIVDEKLQEYLVEEFIGETLSRVGYSHTQVQKTPVGEKITIHASRPGLIVGSKGSNIKKLTKVLKTKFRFDNPIIEISEVADAQANARLVAENIAFQLEKFGPQRFKAIGYQSMEGALRSGALGIEILISGKLPSSRAKSWRFYLGYLKKCGDLAVSTVKTAYTQAKLKSGIIGVQVRILPAGVILPDRVQLYSQMSEISKDGAEKTVEEKVVSIPDAEKEAQAEKKSEEKTAEDKAKKAKKPRAPKKKAESSPVEQAPKTE